MASVRGDVGDRVRPVVDRRVVVLAGLMLAAFTFNTTENLLVGLLPLVSVDLHVPLAAVGYLVSGYGITVAACSLPVAHLTRGIPRRHVLAGVLAALVLASGASALGGSYGVLLAARVATALAQALFWAVLGPTAVGLFAPRHRGRVVGVLSVAGSLATVLGVPAGTWLGQHGGWHTPFLVLSGFGAASLVVVGTLLPTTRPGEGHAARGTAPDRRRFAVVLATTVLSVTGAFAGFTYVVAFLTGVSGFRADSVSALLLVFGAAGIAGVTATGPLLDRFPWATLTVPVASQAVALLVLCGYGGTRAVVVVMLALLGASVGPIFMATQSLVLQVAPGRTELAAAANSAAFNAGVALGAFAGGAVLPAAGVRGAVLLGGLLSVAALAVLLGGWLVRARTCRALTGRSGSASQIHK